MFFIKRCKFFIIVAVLFLFPGIVDSRQAQAASASVSVTADNSSVVKGDIVYVIITISSPDAIGGFKGYFSYDNSVLKYVTGGSVASGNDDEFLVSDLDRETGTNKIKYSVKFIARAAGDTTIILKKPYAVYTYGDNPSAMSVSYSPLNIVVSKKSQTSSANKPDKTSKPKETGIPDETSKPDSTEEPERTMSPEVTKEPGNTGGDVSRTSAPLNGSGGSRNSGKVRVSLRKGKVVINTKDEYTVADVSDKEVVPEGFGKTEMKLDGRLITVYASESDTEHQFVLIYCKRKGSDAQFYLYDKTSLMLMPYQKVQAWYRGNSGNAVVTGGRADNVKVEKYRYLLAIAIIICLLLIIINISVYMHFKGINKDELSEILKEDIEEK